MAPDQVRAVSEKCRRRWPGVDPAHPDAALAELFRAGPDAGKLHLEDLWLASACAGRDTAALEFFDKEVLRGAVVVAARIDPSPEFRDELAQTVRELLFAPRHGAPRLADYVGRGSLSSWTRAIALRAGLRLRKKLGTEPSDAAIEEATSAASPELSFIKEQFRGEFQSALAAALRSLDRRDRTLLRMHFVEGVNLDWLANANGVHRTTIVRWLASARAAVLKRTRAQLATLLEGQATEIDSLIELMRSRLDLSLGELLRSSAP